MGIQFAICWDGPLPENQLCSSRGGKYSKTQTFMSNDQLEDS